MGGALRHLPAFLTAMRPLLHPDDELMWPIKPPRMTRFYWDQWEVNRLARQQKADVVLSLLNFGPIHPIVPHVLCQRNPAYFHRLLRNGAPFIKRKLAYLAIRGANQVIAPSQTMKMMICNTHPDLDPAKVRVVYHGVNHAVFHPAPPRDPPLYPQVLYVAHRGPRWKNHWVIEVAARDLPVNLMIADNVPQSLVPELYRHADVFAFPSWGESFGLPMLEAMASGLPIVAADVPVNREILGDCALFYSPPDSPRLLRLTLEHLLADRDLQAELGQRGLERSKGFSWEKCAQETMAILREVI